MKTYAAWTTREIALLREHYPRGGAVACLPHLPRHTESAIRQKAAELGIAAGGTGRPASDRAFRCALFSDGMLLIAARRGRLELDVEEARMLLGYLGAVLDSAFTGGEK